VDAMGTFHRPARTAIRWAFFVFAVALLTAAGALAEPPRHTLRILAPGNGAVVAPGKTLVIGATNEPDARQVEIDVNAKVRVTAKVSRGGFRADVYLVPGKNVLTVRVADTSVSAAILASATPNFKWHPDVGNCAACHPDDRNSFQVAHPLDALCYQCHDRKDTRKQVHGPIGSGDCTTCHDPHGSPHRALATASPEILCGTCHDQASSGKHMMQSRGKGCTTCHDPHASDQSFLRK
jgi:predicted CXXCH cytochrome family protein